MRSKRRGWEEIAAKLQLFLATKVTLRFEVLAGLYFFPSTLFSLSSHISICTDIAIASIAFVSLLDVILLSSLLHTLGELERAEGPKVPMSSIHFLSNAFLPGPAMLLGSCSNIHQLRNAGVE